MDRLQDEATEELSSAQRASAAVFGYPGKRDSRSLTSVIHVALWLDRAECLVRLQSHGHAPGATGSNTVCAAVSALLGSSARLLAAQTDLAVDGSADREGELEVVVSSCPEKRRSWLGGVTALLLQGLDDIAVGYPEQVRVTVTRGVSGIPEAHRRRQKQKGDQDGT
ncbi:MAG: ribosomal-processing cysteine protease Prp [Spirochaetaceae bacterium]|nr:MAG: ribosomal-processing cysteine protease Prp [Spirochaetaceae bacterium]